jgi:hypothetical protein
MTVVLRTASLSVLPHHAGEIIFRSTRPPFGSVTSPPKRTGSHHVARTKTREGGYYAFLAVQNCWGTCQPEMCMVHLSSARKMSGNYFGGNITISFLILSESSINLSLDNNSLAQWNSTFFVRVPPEVISLQLCTPQFVGVYFKLCTSASKINYKNYIQNTYNTFNNNIIHN